MFRVQHAVQVYFDHGFTIFSRMTKIPFPPFRGLSLSYGELEAYEIEWVGWLEESRLFMTQGVVLQRELTLEQTLRRLQKNGWEEEPKYRRLRVVAKKEPAHRKPPASRSKRIMPEKS